MQQNYTIHLCMTSKHATQNNECMTAHKHGSSQPPCQCSLRWPSHRSMETAACRHAEEHGRQGSTRLCSLRIGPCCMLASPTEFAPGSTGSAAEVTGRAAAMGAMGAAAERSAVAHTRRFAIMLAEWWLLE